MVYDTIIQFTVSFTFLCLHSCFGFHENPKRLNYWYLNFVELYCERMGSQNIIQLLCAEGKFQCSIASTFLHRLWSYTLIEESKAIASSIFSNMINLLQIFQYIINYSYTFVKLFNLVVAWAAVTKHNSIIRRTWVLSRHTVFASKSKELITLQQIVLFGYISS